MDAIINIIREAPIDWLLIVWVDEAGAHEVEDEGAKSKAPNDDPCDEAGAVWEPKPAMLHRHHVGHPITEAIAT